VPHVAAAFAVLQGLDVVAAKFGWPAPCHPVGSGDFESGSDAPGIAKP
jgi:hypothetical protein